MNDLQHEERWGVWSKHVLAELERNEKEISELRKDLIELRILAEGRYQSLYAKSSIFGIIGGSLAIIMSILMKLTGLF